MFTHRITQTYNDDAGMASSVQGTYTGQTKCAFDGTIAASTMGFAIDLAFLKTAMQSFLLYSSQAVTFKTNSTTTPAQTISLTAGQQIIWGHDFSSANPITADVTQVYIDNAGTNPTTVKIRVLST
jgi:hypothetical protein